MFWAWNTDAQLWKIENKLLLLPHLGEKLRYLVKWSRGSHLAEQATGFHRQPLISPLKTV